MYFQSGKIYFLCNILGKQDMIILPIIVFKDVIDSPYNTEIGLSFPIMMMILPNYLNGL
jgi:hypothetical protein